MRVFALATVTAVLCCFATGCVQENWTYRLVNDVQVYGSESAIRPGPLTLIPVVPGSPVSMTEPQPEKLSDEILKQKVTIKVKAESDLVKLRSTLGENHPDVIRQKELIAATERDIAELTRKAGVRQASIAAANVKPKTVLVIALDHVGPGPITTHMGGDFVDRYSRMLVIILDQPLPKETIWCTPENSILVSYSPYTPPERTYVGAEGSVKIISISQEKVVADVSVRTRSDVDEEDVDFFRVPWEMRGRRTFTNAGPRDALFRTGAIRWGLPNTPTTQPVSATARGE